MATKERLDHLLAIAAEREAAGQFDEAEAILARILVSAPDQPAVLHRLGILAFRKGRLKEAIERVERAIKIAPTQALFYRDLCELYRKGGRYDDALAAGRQAVQLIPDDSHAHHNLSLVHYHRLELDASISEAEKALLLDDNMAGAHFTIAQAALLRGDLERGWDEYEWRFRLAGVPPLMPASDGRQWDGRKLASTETLLLIADQGYGDAIQFSRYIGWAASRCANIAVACNRALHPIIMQQPGIGRIFDRWEDQPEFAAYCPLSSLPRLSNTRIEMIPADIPYLRADAGRTATWAERLWTLLPRGWRRIGIVWAGRPDHANDDTRSFPLTTFVPLTALPGTALVSLQKGAAQREIGAYWGRGPLINLGPEILDYGDTMAILDCLELLITADTSVAHLAGAMGKQVWILLPYAPDWRWLLDRGDSPWYPTARLFRQPASREWEPVIAKIVAELGNG
jgi:hypothetical protein